MATTDRPANRSPQLVAPAEQAEEWDVIVRPPQGWSLEWLGELWPYRELLAFLVWRNLKIRYKQTVLGAAWAVLQPLLTMLIFTVIFGRFAGIPSDGIPYPLFAYAALVPWTYFSGAVSQASNSLVENSRMVTRIYFPRLLLPLASVLAGLADFAIAFALLLIMLLATGQGLHLKLLAVPLFLGIAVMAALGAGLWLSALNVKYRDVRYATAFLMQFWLFATPVAYPTTMIPEQWRPLYALNPMVGTVEGLRWTLFGQEPLPSTLVAISLLSALVMLLTGLAYFRRLEDSFADVI